MCSESWPNIGALESGHNMHGVLVAYTQAHLGVTTGHRVGTRTDQLDQILARALFARLRDQTVKPSANLARTQIARRRYELDPQRHGSFAAIAQLEQSTTRRRRVVHEIKHAHLIQIQNHLIIFIKLVSVWI